MNKSPFQQVKDALGQYGPGGISLLVGEPWFGPDDEIREALASAAQESNLYSPPGGLPELKEKICRIEEKRGLIIKPENLIIGNGSKSLLFGLLTLKGKKGVMAPLPAYPPMLVQPELMNNPLFTIETDKHNFRLSVDALKSLKTLGSAMVFSSPANPTGLILTEAEQRELLEWAGENRVYLIADEVYCDFAFNNTFKSLGAIKPDFDNVAVVRSFSKSLGICGWRMGYIIADPATVAELTRWQTLALNPPSTLIQKTLLNLDDVKLSGAEENKDYFHELSLDIGQIFSGLNIPFIWPEGGFYLFLNLEEMIGSSEMSSSAEFCIKLAEKAGIATWPGEDFGVPGWARIAFGNINPDEKKTVFSRLEKRLVEYLDF